MSAADHIQPAQKWEQTAFFDKDLYKKPVLDISGFTHDYDTLWHSSLEEAMPQQRSAEDQDYGQGYGFHVGTAWSAARRAEDDPNGPGVRVLHPLYHTEPYNASLMTDEQANWSDEADQAVRSGQHVGYINETEDRGSISIRAPREQLRTWREQVLSNPDADPVEIRAAHRGYDLIYTPHKGQPVGRPRGLTASPITISPTTPESLEDLVNNIYHPEDDKEEYDRAMAGDDPDATTVTLYPRFVRPKPKRYPPASKALRLPGF